MGDLDLANCIRLFKHQEDSQNSEQPNSNYCAIIPVKEQNIIQTIIHPDNEGRYGSRTDENYIFPDKGVDELIRFRTELEDLFSDCGNVLGIRSVLWNEISCRLFERGVFVNGEQCYDKWNSLYSDYLEMAKSNDEGRISSFKNFSAFEKIYKIRSAFTDSEITEKVIPIESEHDLFTDETAGVLVENEDLTKNCEDVETENNFGIEREFTEEMSQENCQANDYYTLKEMIKVAENLLDEDIKKEKILYEDVKTDAGKTEERKQRAKRRKFRVQDPAWSYNRRKCRDETVLGEVPKPRRSTAVDSRRSNINQSSEESKFLWDTDSTRCFLDLRLYVESSHEVKKSILGKYKRLGKFVSRKMLSHGYQISEYECKRMWGKLFRCYKKEAKNFRKNNEGVSVGKYFYEMDKVMKKSGRAKSPDEAADFNWTDESVRALISFRAPMENAFSTFKRYAILWQYITSQMATSKFFPTRDECAIKWLDLCEYYDFCSQAVSLGLKGEKIAWKYFLDMYRAFQRNAKSSERRIEYPELREFLREFAEPFGKIKVQEDSVQSSTAPASLDTSETFQGKKIETTHEEECWQDGNALDSPTSAKAEGDQYRLKVTVERANDTEIPREEISNEFEDKTLLSKSDERFGQSYKFSMKSESNCEEKCNCSNFTWTQDATLSLLNRRLNKKLECKHLSLDDIDLWKEIAARMRSSGYNVCHKFCKSHWDSLKVVELDEIARKNYSTESKVLKLLPFKKNVDVTTSEAMGAGSSDAGDSSKITSGCVWNEKMITLLIELKFCKGIRELRKYSRPIAIKMRAAGYHYITPSDCSKKWMSLRQCYNRCLVRKIRGRDIKWEYFGMMNKHIEDLASEMELHVKNGSFSLVQLPDCVHKLMRLKLLHQEFFAETKTINEPNDTAALDDNVPGEIIEQPDNSRFVIDKRKADVEFDGGRAVKKLFTNTDHVEGVNKAIRVSDEEAQIVDEEAVIDLSMKVLGPHSEQTAVQNIAASDYFKVCKIDDRVDSTKENVACFVADKNTGLQFSGKCFERRQSARSSIFCDKKSSNEIFSVDKAGNNRAKATVLIGSQPLITQFKYDVPIQDWSVNSTQNFRVENREEWNDAATDLLIDLRIEHERKFPTGYSERSEILWDKIAEQMVTTGYNFTRTECWQKWCSLRRMYENEIADIKEKRVIQAWPYFRKLDSIYKKLEKIYQGFRWILPKKRIRNDDYDEKGNQEVNLSLPKKLIISVLPSKSCCEGISITNSKKDALEEIGACDCLGKTIVWY